MPTTSPGSRNIRSPLFRLAVLAGVLVAALAVSAYAQSGGAPDGVEGGALPTIYELFEFSPWINGVLLGLSVVALMLFLYFLATINPRAMVPADFVDEVTKLVIRGKYEAASDLCRAHRRVFIATVVQRCVDNARKGHSVIMGMIDTEGRRRADMVWNRISYLADVSNVAPMLGLLGTVLGMLKAFFLLPQQSGDVTAAGLAEGVGQAMSTTMFGLAVAILATVFYSIVKARATRTLADAEAAIHSIADHMKRDEEEEGTEARTHRGAEAQASTRSNH